MAVADVISLLLYLNAIVVIVLLIYEERDPSTTLAWALTLILLPGLGIVFYLLFGRNWRTIGTKDKRRAEAERLGDEKLAPLYALWSARAAEVLDSQPAPVQRMSAAVRKQTGTRPLPCEDLEVFVTGKTKFDRLYSDIQAAESSVHLEYFIWEADALTSRFCDLLAEKAASGVAVRVMYDWVGSIAYSKAQLKKVERAGGIVHADSAHWAKLNYRNHRKIAVIDGAIGYTGGMNMGEEYSDGGRRFATWRDTHVRLTGPLVADLQRMFAERWFRVAEEDLFAEKYFPSSEARGGAPLWAQMVHSGPESKWEALRNTIQQGILSANERVWLQSPYFIPDDPIMTALVTQALSGVDVRLMMAGIPDKKIAWNAAFSYIDELLAAGGKVYHYEAGFFHPKTMTIDGTVCMIGTTNLDIRSLMLHDELSLIFFDERIAAEHDRQFEADMADCREVSLATLEEFSRLGRFGNAVARLWSRLL